MCTARTLYLKHTVCLLVKITIHTHGCLGKREIFFPKAVFCIIASVTFFQFLKQNRNFLHKLHKYHDVKIFSFNIVTGHYVELFLKSESSQANTFGCRYKIWSIKTLLVSSWCSYSPPLPNPLFLFSFLHHVCSPSPFFHNAVKVQSLCCFQWK